MGYLIVSTTVIVFLNLFSCIPISGGWDHDPALHPKCIDTSTYLFINYLMHIITDVLLMALPIPMLLRMQLRPKAKYGLVGMFAGGIS